MSRCAPTSPGCACRGSARASSRWPPASIPATSDRRHQSMHHFVADAPWEAAAVLRVARDWVLAADGPARPRGRVDRRRHRVPQERPAFGGRGPAVLRRPGQTGQLPSGGECVGGERGREPARRLSALPAGELGERRTAGGGPPGCPTTSRFSRSGRSRWGRSTPCRPRACRRPRCSRMPATATPPQFREALTTAGLAYVVGVKKETTAWPPGRGAAAPEALEGPWPAAHARAAHRDAHPAEPQAVGRRAAADGVADGDVARRDAGRDALPLRAAARAARPSR